MEIIVSVYLLLAILFFFWAIRGMRDMLLVVFLAALVWPITLIWYLFDSDE